MHAYAARPVRILQQHCRLLLIVCLQVEEIHLFRRVRLRRPVARPIGQLRQRPRVSRGIMVFVGNTTCEPGPNTGGPKLMWYSICMSVGPSRQILDRVANRQRGSPTLVVMVVDHAQFEEVEPRFRPRFRPRQVPQSRHLHALPVDAPACSRCVRANRTAVDRCSENSGAPLLSSPQRTSSSSNPSSQPSPLASASGTRLGCTGPRTGEFQPMARSPAQTFQSPMPRVGSTSKRSTSVVDVDDIHAIAQPAVEAALLDQIARLRPSRPCRARCAPAPRRFGRSHASRSRFSVP